MLHIFDYKDQELEPPGAKKPTLTRLQSVLSGQERTAAVAEPPAADKTEPAKADGDSAAPLVWSRPSAAVRPAGAGLAATVGDSMGAQVSSRTPEFQRFAEEFTKSFLGALSRAVEDIHGLVVQDRGTVELLARDHRELSARVVRLEERVAQQANNSAMEAALQEVMKRLDAQAAAIRALYHANQARDEKLERLIAAFQGLQTLSGAAAPAATPELPEGL